MAGSGGVGEEAVLDVLCRAGRPLSFDEIAGLAGWKGDRRALRRLLADLVRRGLVIKVPDYEERRMKFAAGGGACG